MDNLDEWNMAQCLRKKLKNEKNIFPWWDSNPWHIVKVGRLRPLGHPGLVLEKPWCFIHNHRRFSWLAMEPEHFRLCNFWVQSSYGFYFNFLSYFWCYITISCEKTFYSSLFQTHKRYKKYLLRLLQYKKMDERFFAFPSQVRDPFPTFFTLFGKSF